MELQDSVYKTPAEYKAFRLNRAAQSRLNAQTDFIRRQERNFSKDFKSSKVKVENQLMRRLSVQEAPLMAGFQVLDLPSPDPNGFPYRSGAVSPRQNRRPSMAFRTFQTPATVAAGLAIAGPPTVVTSGRRASLWSFEAVPSGTKLQQTLRRRKSYSGGGSVFGSYSRWTSTSVNKRPLNSFPDSSNPSRRVEELLEPRTHGEAGEIDPRKVERRLHEAGSSSAGDSPLLTDNEQLQISLPEPGRESEDNLNSPGPSMDIRGSSRRPSYYQCHQNHHRQHQNSDHPNGRKPSLRQERILWLKDSNTETNGTAIARHVETSVEAMFANRAVFGDEDRSGYNDGKASIDANSTNLRNKNGQSINLKINDRKEVSRTGSSPESTSKQLSVTPDFTKTRRSFSTVASLALSTLKGSNDVCEPGANVCEASSSSAFKDQSRTGQVLIIKDQKPKHHELKITRDDFLRKASGVTVQQETTSAPSGEGDPISASSTPATARVAFLENGVAAHPARLDKLAPILSSSHQTENKPLHSHTSDYAQQASNGKAESLRPRFSIVIGNVREHSDSFLQLRKSSGASPPSGSDDLAKPPSRLLQQRVWQFLDKQKDFNKRFPLRGHEVRNLEFIRPDLLKARHQAPGPQPKQVPREKARMIAHVLAKLGVRDQWGWLGEVDSRELFSPLKS